MIAQNILFPNPRICSERDLYMRLGNNAEYVFVKDEINFTRRFSIVFFDTYFNSFSIGKWSKYTNIKNVILNLRLKGEFIVTLWHEDLINERSVKEIVNEQIVKSDQEKQFSFGFNSLKTSGIYYFCLNALKANSVYYGGNYEIEEGDTRNIKLGVSICHYRKEAYIRRNMESIASFLNKNPKFASRLEVFISDNAQTLSTNDAPYDFVHIFPNKNVGGAGGFTRCIMEIQKTNESDNSITHALLMDDDLTFDPEILYRTWAFLTNLKDKYSQYFFSGLMNRQDFKNIQHENGALWNGGDFISLKGHSDMNIFQNVLFNDCIEESVEFAPWWYCGIPIESTENNLPLPIFYREDDAEYGMRCAKGIISMNGICVWHEPFENKFVPFVCYYHSRNLHLVNCLHHPENGKKSLLNYTYREIKRELCFLRYKIADLYLQAAEDFMKGIDWFKKTDTMQNHKKVVTNCYKLQNVDEIKEMPFIYGEYIWAVNKPPMSKIKRFIWHHSQSGNLIKAKRNVWVPIAPGQVREEMFVRAKKAYHFDLSQQRGFITERSKKEYRRIMRRFRKLKNLVNRKYNTVAKDYRNRIQEIQTLDFWNKYLEV